ncbi:hypothetical protein Asppvi_010246 [Aspergillus pseudoviridinutans]|uniref:BZIP domain-containing protein n=1 Tax=Aspergillus pseudoviridinutans TaxID=1517512 RepID=A0A9P3BP84_9EURO|nr:uncharacterized protein Asppvi_010246 [Aspergillus pseudoviridinutans]GIJ91281.1 hypothetical protein Asppvi_010246 [Aspergillus pseudoviridinutans]
MTYMFPGVSIPSLVTTEGDSDSQAEGHHTVAHRLSLNHGPEVYRTVKLSSRSARPSPVTPTESNLEPQTDSYSFMLHQSTPTGGNHQFLSVKRRMQNRAAQRRFRQRKEDQQKSLKQKTVDLEEKYQELSDRLHEKSEEVCRLLREKNALKCEIQDLRKRWQMVGLLLQHPKGPQSLSSLFAADPPSLSGSSQTEPAAADESLRRLDAFLLMPNDKAALP